MTSESEHVEETTQYPSANIYANQTPHYRFNLEELRVLRQCNRESFYQRSLPLSTVLCIGTYYAVKTGFLRANPSYGAIPKMVVASLVGYFTGKFSYQTKCAEKLMQLPGSPIGEMLRQRKQQGMHQELIPETFSWSPQEPVKVEPMHELDERPMHEGFEDYSRPNFDAPLLEEEELPPASKTTTYEELRRKNREDYEVKRTKMSYSRGSTSETPIHTASTQFEGEHPSKKKTEAKNIYGDVWEE